MDFRKNGRNENGSENTRIEWNCNSWQILNKNLLWIARKDIRNLKDKLFSKIVKKDYNNDLEKVLSKKDFSEEVKSTLLSMFYKIENGYNDYNKVKRNTYDKKHYIEKLIDTIDKDCEKIEFSKDEKIDIDNKEIICKPIELNLLNSISKIKKKNIVVTYLDESIEEAFSDFLNTGNNINNIERKK